MLARFSRVGSLVLQKNRPSSWAVGLLRSAKPTSSILSVAVAAGPMAPFSSATPGADQGVNEKSMQQLYLHVGPSGDCWTGSSIFAAKHLQPDYVKSVPLPRCDTRSTDMLVELLEEDETLAQNIYDTGVLPPELFERAKRMVMEEKDDEV